MMDRRIRVLLIIFSFDIEAIGGGISRFVVSLCKALDQTKFKISICGMWNHGTQLEAERIQSLNEAGIKAFTCAAWDNSHPYRSFFKAYCRLRIHVKNNPIDIVHSHSLFGDIAALLLYFEGRAPVVLRTLHNELRTEWNRRPLRRLLLTNILYPLVFDVEIGVSQYISVGLSNRMLARLLGRQPITIYNAIDLDRFKNLVCNPLVIKHELGVPENAFLVGSVGRLTKQKGYDLLLTAAARLDVPNLFIVIVGDGEDAKTLKQQAIDLRIEKRVIFTGLRSDVDCLLHAFDLYVCSSRWEGLPTVLMEAMASGTPILATDIPGNRELLQPGKSAWIVPAEDCEELATGVIKAYQNPEQGKEFTQNALERVNLFGIEHAAKIHDQLYQLLQIDKQNGSWFNHKKKDAQIKKLVTNFR